MQNHVNRLAEELKSSPNIIYFLLENKAITVGAIATLAFIVRFILALQSESFSDALAKGLEFASILSASTIAVLIYFKDAVNFQIVKKISQKPHTAVFGLGEFSSALLENEIESKNNYIIFEKNTQNEKIEHFKKYGYGVVTGNALLKEHLDQLNFETMDFAVITLGNDRLNIELATNIINHYITKEITTPIKLVVHIINPDLNALFHQKFITQHQGKEGKIDIQTFSFYNEAAESLFAECFIDGEENGIINSDEEFRIVIAGDGELASNVVHQAAQIAHLPNQNRLIIDLVDKHAKAFKQKLVKRYPGILNVVDLNAYNIDNETPEYFQNETLWSGKNLTHVIICYDDEEKNINIATDLFNKTYLEAAVDATLTTRVNFAIFNPYHMNNKINNDKGSFKQFFSFADVKKICTRERLLDEKSDLIAKLMHFGYAQEYDPWMLLNLTNQKTIRKINDKWFDTARLSDRLSNKAQSEHIDMKLKALGLMKIPSSKEPKELLKRNRTILDEKLDKERSLLGLSDTFLKEYSKELEKFYGGKDFEVKYFPKEFKTMFEKLIRAEHNRWNAFHYLNGWRYDEEKNKAKKVHDCLLPLENFRTSQIQITVIYDIYAILYIPNYLANAGYEITEK